MFWRIELTSMFSSLHDSTELDLTAKHFTEQVHSMTNAMTLRSFHQWLAFNLLESSRFSGFHLTEKQVNCWIDAHGVLEFPGLAALPRFKRNGPNGKTVIEQIHSTTDTHDVLEFPRLPCTLLRLGGYLSLPASSFWRHIIVPYSTHNFYSSEYCTFSLTLKDEESKLPIRV